MPKEEEKMKITRKQLRQIIKEALEIHTVPENISSMDPEETYGLGYYKGKGQIADCEKGQKLSGKFADEARSKSAALSAASTFADSMLDDGVPIDDDIISMIYHELLGVARDVQK